MKNNILPFGHRLAALRLKFHHQKYYFLHIGKTGGTYSSAAVRKLAKRAQLNMEFGAHKLQMPKVLASHPKGRFIFGLRDPIEIFTSGFYSRQRKGAPKYNSEWTAGETKAFSIFGTPNELAENLSSSDEQLSAAAQDAMKSIQHVSKGLRYYLGSAEFIEAHKRNVFFILDQEHLDADLEKLYARFGMKLPNALRDAQEKRHANPPDIDRRLSQVAIENLRRHYEPDIAIYHKCKEVRQQILAENKKRGPWGWIASKSKARDD